MAVADQPGKNSGKFGTAKTAKTSRCFIEVFKIFVVQFFKAG